MSTIGLIGICAAAFIGLCSTLLLIVIVVAWREPPLDCEVDADEPVSDEWCLWLTEKYGMPAKEPVR